MSMKNRDFSNSFFQKYEFKKFQKYEIARQLKSFDQISIGTSSNALISINTDKKIVSRFNNRYIFSKENLENIILTEESFIGKNKNDSFDCNKSVISFKEETQLNDQDSLIENVRNLINTGSTVKNSELLLLEKNKQKYMELLSVDFNILVVGDKFCGKSLFIKTFIKNLQRSNCNHKSLNSSTNDNSSNLINNDKTKNKMKKVNDKLNSLDNTENTIDYQSNSFQFNTCERKFKFKLIELSGGVRSENWIQEALYFIHKRNLSYFKSKKENEENDSVAIEDTRIHLCLYFISAKDDKIEDYENMKTLIKHSNLIPVIGNGGELDHDEILKLKSKILMNCKDYNVNLFDIYTAIYKLCKNESFVNFLVGGKYGFCPPFMNVCKNGERIEKKSKYIL